MVTLFTGEVELYRGQDIKTQEEEKKHLHKFILDRITTGRNGSEHETCYKGFFAFHFCTTIMHAILIAFLVLQSTFFMGCTARGPLDRNFLRKSSSFAFGSLPTVQCCSRWLRINQSSNGAAAYLICSGSHCFFSLLSIPRISVATTFWNTNK